MSTTIAPSLGHGPWTQQGIGTTPGYDAIDARRFWGVSLQEGAIHAGSYEVTQRAAGVGMFVDVAATVGAGAIVEGDAVTAQGLYLVAPHSALIPKRSRQPTRPSRALIRWCLRCSTTSTTRPVRTSHASGSWTVRRQPARRSRTAPSGGTWEADRRLWLDADDNVVEDGNPAAAFLYATPGMPVPVEDAVKRGLVEVEKKQAPKPPDKQRKTPARNKAQKQATSPKPPAGKSDEDGDPPKTAKT